MNEATHALEQIRRAELAAAQRVEQARVLASEIEVDAVAGSRRLVEEGRRRGLATAQRHLEEVTTESEKEAEEVLARSQAEAQELEEAAAAAMEELIEEMVRVVLAPPSEPGK